MHRKYSIKDILDKIRISKILNQIFQKITYAEVINKIEKKDDNKIVTKVLTQISERLRKSQL